MHGTTVATRMLDTAEHAASTTEGHPVCVCFFPHHTTEIALHGMRRHRYQLLCVVARFFKVVEVALWFRALVVHLNVASV